MLTLRAFLLTFVIAFANSAFAEQAIDVNSASASEIAEAMTEIVGAPVSLPPRLSRLLTAEERMTPLGNDVKEVENYIMQHSRAVA